MGFSFCGRKLGINRLHFSGQKWRRPKLGLRYCCQMCDDVPLFLIIMVLISPLLAGSISLRIVKESHTSSPHKFNELYPESGFFRWKSLIIAT